MPEVLKLGLYITLGLVCFFLYRKKKLKPSKLKLQAYKDNKTGLPGLRKVQAEVVEEEGVVFSGSSKHHGVFTFCGQKYSAWEVLRVPMGADKNEIKKAYILKLEQHPNQSGLLHAAYKALAE